MVFKAAVLAGVVAAAQVFSCAAQAAESGKSAGDVVVRLRGISVVPDERSTVSAIGGASERLKLIRARGRLQLLLYQQLSRRAYRRRHQT